jgi:hypothetical protein
MRTFGKSQGGGRRSAARAPAPFLAVLSTITHDHHAVLRNISRAGARFSAPVLPGEGEELIFKAEGVQAFGRVVWSKDEQCGVAFDGPILTGEFERLRREANIRSLAGLSAQERAAMEEWELGIAS